MIYSTSWLAFSNCTTNTLSSSSKDLTVVEQQLTTASETAIEFVQKLFHAGKYSNIPTESL